MNTLIGNTNSLLELMAAEAHLSTAVAAVHLAQTHTNGNALDLTKALRSAGSALARARIELDRAKDKVIRERKAISDQVRKVKRRRTAWKKKTKQTKR